jgi:hypothetical protein
MESVQEVQEQGRRKETEFFCKPKYHGMKWKSDREIRRNQPIENDITSSHLRQQDFHLKKTREVEEHRAMSST